MSRIYLIFTFCFVFSLSFAQTVDLEKEQLNAIIQKGGMSPAELQKLGSDWRHLLEAFGGYPALPYNEETKQIEFSFTQDLPSIKKQTIIDRIEEWVAVNYGSIDAVLHYKNERTGKLIVKGHFSLVNELILNNFWGFELSNKITEGKCKHTVIFTIADGKLKVEYTNLKYEVSYSAQYSTAYSAYIPSGTIETGLHQLYPVTAGKQDSWQPKLTALKITDLECKLSFKDLTDYIKKHQSDYQF